MPELYIIHKNHMYQWETQPLDVRRYSYFLKSNICWFNHWCTFTVNIFFGGEDGVTVREAVECKWGSELPVHVLHLTIVELTLQWLYSLDPQYSYITFLKLSKLSLPCFFSGFSFKTLDNTKNLSNYLTPGCVQTEII